ncbi:PQQ-dependent sugar dehydrogenase [Streptomyces daliensis]
MSRRRSSLSGLLLALALLLFSPAATAAPAPAPNPASATEAADTGRVPLAEVTATTTQVASGLRRPTAVVAPDDGTDRLFVVEKPGRVRVYHPETGLAEEPLLDLTSRIDSSANERGLLGIALAPDFAESQELYLAYTALPDGAVTLARQRLDGSDPEVLLSQEHAEYGNHNGGQLAFGPDGYLYWAIGDGGGSGDPFRSGQRLDTLLGKILRLDVSRSCGDLAYCVPKDNPFVGKEGARGEIWLYGVRNPWRFSFDRADGSLWIGDVGQGRWEEIDHLARGEGGKNLGWSCYEGWEVFDETHCLPGEKHTAPVFTYSPYTGGCSVIGGTVYRGKEYADLVGGTYLATDYCSNTVWALRSDGEGGYEQAEIGEMPTQVTSFGATVDGELYVVNDLPGGLHRVSFDKRTSTCRVAYSGNAWGTGLKGEITLTNTGTTPVSDWQLAFNVAGGQSVSSGWGATFTQKGNAVTADGASYNGTIEPGESVELGYLAGHAGNTSPPTGFALNGGNCVVADD